jgi:tRNA nucleotidyltransferase (CCA-adding enzyme)
MGELSKHVLGAQPAKALRIARDTGVLVHVLPEFEPAIGFDQESRYHDMTVDEHTFAVVQATADAKRALAVRLAALFHDLGKPLAAWRGTDGRLHYYAKRGYADRSHEQVGAELAGTALRRLRYPNALRDRVCRIVRHHMFQVGKGDELRARRFLAKHGDEIAFQLVDHKEADFLGKRGSEGPPPLEDVEKLRAFRKTLQRERKQPHRLADLAVDGSDLIELGFRPGPELGRALHELHRDVVDDPARNTRTVLLRLARAKLGR